MGDDNFHRVIRGGSWGLAPAFACVASPHYDTPSGRFGALGFRLSRLVSPIEQLAEVDDE